MALARVEVVFQVFPGTAGAAADRGVANVDFEVTIGKHTSKGKTDADGKVVLFIPSTGKAVLDILGTKYAVRPVAALDAKATKRGVQQRLQGLGYELGTVDGVVGGRTGRAILQFQADNNIDTQGLPDGSFEDPLAAQFGA